MDDAQHLRELLDERTRAYRDEFAAVRRELVTLKALLDERSSLQSKAVDAALAVVKEENEKAERASEKRFDSVNEFREQLRAQADTFVTKAEQNVVNTGLTDRITRAEQTQERAAGRTTGVSAAKAALYSGVGTIATVILVGIAILTFNS